MGKLIFKDLYLFSPSEKLAKKISFAPGRTIITSDAHDGTDRGKSVIMKALYGITPLTTRRAIINGTNSALT